MTQQPKETCQRTYVEDFCCVLDDQLIQTSGAWFSKIKVKILNSSVNSFQPCQEVRIIFKTFSIYICTRYDTGFYQIISPVTEREALEESKANFVELQNIAANKREALEEKKKAYEFAEKEALEAKNNVKIVEETLSRQTYSKLLNLLLA